MDCTGFVRLTQIRGPQADFDLRSPALAAELCLKKSRKVPTSVTPVSKVEMNPTCLQDLYLQIAMHCPYTDEGSTEEEKRSLLKVFD